MQLTTVLGQTSGMVWKARATRARQSCSRMSRAPEENLAIALKSSILRGSYCSCGSSTL